MRPLIQGKEIEAMRDVQRKKNAVELLSIVCQHIILAPQPTKAILFKVTKANNRHDGKVYACEGCAITFESPLFDPRLFQVVPERKFVYNIASFTER